MLRFLHLNGQPFYLDEAAVDEINDGGQLVPLHVCDKCSRVISRISPEVSVLTLSNRREVTVLGSMDRLAYAIEQGLHVTKGLAEARARARHLSNLCRADDKAALHNVPRLETHSLVRGSARDEEQPVSGPDAVADAATDRLERHWLDADLEVEEIAHKHLNPDDQKEEDR